MVYLRLCVDCRKKSFYPNSGLVSKPILHCAQLDLIDMQSQNINYYRFIVNYRNHLTKFVVIKPLKTKQTEEIVNNLLGILPLLERRLSFRTTIENS